MTLRELSKAIGMAASTVSMALKNDSRIAADTRRQVQEMAKKLGYVPDPMLASLNVYRNSRRPEKYQSTIAFLNCHQDRDAFRWNTTYTTFVESARDAALKRGYKVEEFWIHEPGLTYQRFNQILIARNITGILIGPMPSLNHHIHLDWNWFSVVSIGHTFKRPRVHNVSNNQYTSIILAIRKIRQYGYRRIGLVLPKFYDNRVNQLWSSGYGAAQQLFEKKDRIPLLNWMTRNSKVLRKWIEGHRPEVILSLRTAALEQLDKVGFRVPEDIAFAELNCGASKEKVAGIDQNSPEVGASAVNFLIDMMQRSERGIPETPRTLLIDGKWVDGPTLPRRTKK